MRRRFLAPEVVQTSAMDCGPAALTALLQGYGISASYGRLREACQTDVDGTSINTLEDMACRLGLNAVQVMLPAEFLTMGGVDPFPALLVTRGPAGAPHFVVAWRRVGRRVQLMDPARGRRWVDATTLHDSLFVHRMPIAAAAWRGWQGEEAQRSFRARLVSIGAAAKGALLLGIALDDPTWRAFAALDAATRMTQSLVNAGAIPHGKPAEALLTSLFERARADAAAATDDAPPSVPWNYWSAAPTGAPTECEEQVMLSGAVLLRVHGLRAPTDSLDTLSEDLAAAVQEPVARPLRQLGAVLRADGVLAPTALGLTLLAASFGGAIEVLLFRGMLDVGRHLGLIEQRLAGLGVLAALLVLLLVLDLSFAHGVLRMGRNLETRLRVAFLSKIPRLQDRYFQSRPASDMAHRCHALYPIRDAPQFGGRLLRAVLDLLVVGAGLIWIHPRSWPLVGFVVITSTLSPWLVQRTMAERDQRVRSFEGSLARFYLDAVLGLMPLRAHGAQPALRREHAMMTREWARAAVDRVRAWIFVEAFQQIMGTCLAAAIIVAYLLHTPEPASMLLLLYWALSLPTLGQEIAQTTLLYAPTRNRFLRLSEPLGAREDEEVRESESLRAIPGSTHSTAAHIVFRDVVVQAAGHTILDDVNLTIPGGSHVAILGPSGAGKSSLVGVLLGWHRPASGEVLVDGLPLRGAHRQRLRTDTAWVDPSVQLWNRSLLDNVQYGSSLDGHRDVGAVLDDATLLELVERLPDGLQTRLGEGGALVAGGEGQRVRLGRAFMRDNVRLVILDEAFRGLDRERRHALLMAARARWKNATLVCVTHDVSETCDFDRVLVIENGRVFEDGSPSDLLAREDSRYRTMLEAEKQVRQTLWAGNAWRRLAVRNGHVAEDTSPQLSDEGAA